jgi:hypothetical protein
MLLLALVLLIFASGCVSDTGQVTREEFFEEDTLNDINVQAEANKEAVAPIAPVQENKSMPSSKPNVTNQTKPTKPAPPKNETKTCKNVTKACPDGFQAACQCCGNCTTCEPDCTGHNVCVEDWSCSEWSACSSSQRTRECSDEASCGTSGNRPEETQACEEPEPQQQGMVRFSEIMYNPSQNENYNEWIEIFNPTQFPVDLTDWTLCKKKILPGYMDYYTNEVMEEDGMALAAGSYALITDSGDKGTQVYSSFNVSHASLALRVDAGSLCGGLTNSGNKTLFINDNSGNLIESIEYQDLATEGYSIERNLGSWNASLVENGTPGY